MQKDEKLNKETDSEEALAAIADIAWSGGVLQEVMATGSVSERLASACGDLFAEIRELASAAAGDR